MKKTPYPRTCLPAPLLQYMDRSSETLFVCLFVSVCIITLFTIVIIQLLFLVLAMDATLHVEPACKAAIHYVNS